MIFYLRYVNHERVPAYEALGWYVVGCEGQGLGTHAYWSCLMRYDGENPKEPEGRG